MTVEYLFFQVCNGMDQENPLERIWLLDTAVVLVLTARQSTSAARVLGQQLS